MDGIPAIKTEPNDQELVLQFESLGDNCEFGLVQRRVGVEPLGLLRFSGAPLRNLLRALANRFEQIGDPDHIRLQPENGEFMIKLAKYDFTYHSDVKVGDVEPERLVRQQSRVVSYLARKLVDDLRDPGKIFIFRQNEPLAASDLVDLRLALAAYGNGRLLWVQQACPGHSPGSVVMVDDRLMVGYVRRFAPRSAVPELDLESWLAVLREAWRIAQEAGPPGEPPRAAHVPAPARVDITFGAEGNARAYQGFGWSGAEAGFTWSVGERSKLTIPSPGPAADYWLEMHAIPHVHPPLLRRQRLDIFVKDVWVHSFDPMPRGEVACAVPGHLIAGQESVEIVLNHPHAASPMLVGGVADDRRLAICFYRLALVCA
ncbi:MAG TPA: hypothetical protein VHB27_11655 [Rhodopila sp.]|uniref:hypothetical protein n=1 Tax=Rhodopila sp. TaxID=2480087 RepID=UPI002BF7FEB7|nr:hypothetical protein [Rhodopila sp.]HVY15876.1 hypothetical protein [Rhodopila sp.]